jgi:hypothetical protein
LDRRRRVARATQKGATAIITSYLDSGLLLIFHPQQAVDTQFTAIGVNRLQKIGEIRFSDGSIVQLCREQFLGQLPHRRGGTK